MASSSSSGGGTSAYPSTGPFADAAAVSAARSSGRLPVPAHPYPPPPPPPPQQQQQQHAPPGGSSPGVRSRHHHPSHPLAVPAPTTPLSPPMIVSSAAFSPGSGSRTAATQRCGDPLANTVAAAGAAGGGGGGGGAGLQHQQLPTLSLAGVTVSGRNILPPPPPSLTVSNGQHGHPNASVSGASTLQMHTSLPELTLPSLNVPPVSAGIGSTGTCSSGSGGRRIALQSNLSGSPESGQGGGFQQLLRQSNTGPISDFQFRGMAHANGDSSPSGFSFGNHSPGPFGVGEMGAMDDKQNHPMAPPTKKRRTMEDAFGEMSLRQLGQQQQQHQQRQGMQGMQEQMMKKRGRDALDLAGGGTGTTITSSASLLPPVRDGAPPSLRKMRNGDYSEESIEDEEDDNNPMINPRNQHSSNPQEHPLDVSRSSYLPNLPQQDDDPHVVRLTSSDLESSETETDTGNGSEMDEGRTDHLPPPLDVFGGLARGKDRRNAVVGVGGRGGVDAKIEELFRKDLARAAIRSQLEAEAKVGAGASSGVGVGAVAVGQPPQPQSQQPLRTRDDFDLQGTFTTAGSATGRNDPVGAHAVAGRRQPSYHNSNNIAVQLQSRSFGTSSLPRPLGTTPFGAAPSAANAAHAAFAGPTNAVAAISNPSLAVPSTTAAVTPVPPGRNGPAAPPRPAVPLPPAGGTNLPAARGRSTERRGSRNSRSRSLPRQLETLSRPSEERRARDVSMASASSGGSDMDI